VAQKKQGNTQGAGGTQKKGSFAPLFWCGFILVIILLFIINAQRIKDTLSSTHMVERLTNRPIAEDAGGTGPDDSGEGVGTPQVTIIERDTPAAPGSTAEATGQGEGSVPAVPAVPVPVSPVPAAPPKPAPAKPVETRQRTLYFVQIDNSGMIYTMPSSRAVPVSDSPLIDVLKLLFAGPTADERKRSLRSLIPGGTRVLSASVKNGTVTINLSEDFMFNSYGAEAYLAQLRQLVLTATEFSSVKDVQILIEGRRVDFLAENILIRDPISRETL
jgi:hypothetical protein